MWPEQTRAVWSLLTPPLKPGRFGQPVGKGRSVLAAALLSLPYVSNRFIILDPTAAGHPMETMLLLLFPRDMVLILKKQRPTRLGA